MKTKTWREIHQQWIEEHTKGNDWIVMGVIGLSGVIVYGFGILPIPSLFGWMF